MDQKTLNKLHDIAENMILGNMELAYKELGFVIKGGYAQLESNNLYCSCSVSELNLINGKYVCSACNKEYYCAKTT